MAAAVLSPSSFRHYIERFNKEDNAAISEKLSIPNERAWDFLESNIPWFECSDKQLEETYYYRWWSYRKHLVQTPAGWVITEFLPSVPWAGIYNTISCAAGHHLYEGRWLRDPQYVRDYAEFWLLPEAQPRNYSFWAADAVWAVTLATGNTDLAWRVLPNLVANFHAWERTHLDASWLFRQEDGRDGMEFSLGGSGCRPSINSYMYGEATAISKMATAFGDDFMALEFRANADTIKQSVQGALWNAADQFFETADPKGMRLCRIREEIGFIPWYFNLPDGEFDVAWKQLLDPDGFSAPFGPTTAEKRAPGFMHPEDHDCLWNGPSWPYATTQTLVAMANLLNSRKRPVVSKEDYFRLLTGYSRSQQKNGRPWIAEDLDGETGAWIVDLPRSVCYNHSGFADLIVTGLAGLRPRPSDPLEVNPLLPSGEWPWFCLYGIPYRGHEICILWDQDGHRYGRGSGLTVFADGAKVAHREQIGKLTASLPVKKGITNKRVRWEKYVGGAVLGGSLGTCFDVSVLGENGKYTMYFSWRPKKSIALVESVDGIHWNEPQIVLGPSDGGWEDDVNRPTVVRQGGVYHMWYTGQFEGKSSSIGYATSRDGIDWERHKKPVLVADQAWEKVAVMCPSVIWDEAEGGFRMWFSGGEQYEPDAIGYATSRDGVRWTKREGPIFEADSRNRWEQHKVTACHVLRFEGWHTMFYIGFRDIDHAQIGIARSRDGISEWERLKDNPIISPTVDGWDADACYKPVALFDKATNNWMLWYNGRRGNLEQIGLASRMGADLGF